MRSSLSPGNSRNNSLPVWTDVDVKAFATNLYYPNACFFFFFKCYYILPATEQSPLPPQILHAARSVRHILWNLGLPAALQRSISICGNTAVLREDGKCPCSALPALAIDLAKRPLWPIPERSIKMNSRESGCSVTRSRQCKLWLPFAINPAGNV